LAAAIAGVGASWAPDRYTARTTLLFVAETADAPDVPAAVAASRHRAPPLAFATYLEVLRSDALRVDAAPDLTPARRAGAWRIRTREDPGSALVYVDATAGAPDVAAARSAALADALLAWDRARAARDVAAAVSRTEAQIAALEGSLNDVTFQEAQAHGLAADARRADLATLRGRAAAPATPWSVVGAATRPRRPSNRPPWQAAGLAAGVTLLLGAGLVAAGASLDPRRAT
jgi:hypothetical protein